MINFILCDEEKAFSDIWYTVVNNYFMNYDIECNFNFFSDYNEDFKKIVKKDIGFKIYFLNRKIKDISGIDVARMIREEYDDWSSIIIILDSSNAYKYSVFSARLQILDFINKLDHVKENIICDLEKCIKVYDNRPNILKIKHYNLIEFIEYKHIIYIEKEKDSKTCRVKTTYGDKYYRGTLKQLEKELNSKRFIRTHQSYIVNSDYVAGYYKTGNKVTFRNIDDVVLVSKKYKKNVKDYFEG